MGRRKKNSARDNRKRKTNKGMERPSKNRGFDYQNLEPRQLLAGDLGVAYQPASIQNIFSHDAVTVDQMIQRAEHRPYIENEIIVAVETLGSKANAERVLGQLDWQVMVGSEAASRVNTMMTIETDGFRSVSLVKIDLGENGDVIDAMRELDDVHNVLWSSPNFYQNENPVEFIPNDPDYGNQYHHPLMQNNDAWDFTLGDSDIILGITDDGVEVDHEDLQSNIWTNQGEIPGNGIDDDNNGYIDDVTGWDFSNDTNDPNPDQSGHDHGTHVAGIAAGDTNNGIGIAGTAGAATIMPLQFYRYVNSAWTAEVISETFVYGVDNGAHIISTSYNMDGWVGDPVVTAGYQYIHDNGRIHFNSAGNGGSLNPARQAFEQTLLVVNTTETDTKSGSSNWGTGVDISAPGTNILSTILNDGYGTKSGTSMAAPNAAGVAALIWSQNPTWNRDQVVAQLLGTADNIDAVNPAFAGLLGAGRTNAFSALSQTLAAPQVDSLVGLPSDGESTTDTSLDGFEVRFNQYMDPVAANNAANYQVVSAGVDGILGTADDQTVAVSMASEYMVGSNSVKLTFDGGPLNYGLYSVTLVSGGLENPFGTDLDGDGDGTGGDAFSSQFEITPPAPVSIGPDGSGIYERNFESAFGAPGEVDAFIFQLDAGQTLSVGVSSFVSNLAPSIAVSNPNGTQIGSVTGTGSGAVLDSLTVDVAGTYSILVNSSTNQIGSYGIQMVINAGLEAEEFDGADNATLATAQNVNGTGVSFGNNGDRLAVVASLPFGFGDLVEGESFDSGVLGSQWTTSSSNSNGNIRLSGSEGTAGGANALLMDVLVDDQYSNNEAIWTVDLTNIADPVLVFSHTEWNDENDNLPASFTGSVDGDGVSVSDDGVNWFTILNAPTVANGQWTEESFNLVDVANQFGLNLGANFQVKFQQYDNFAIDTDGRGYDEIQILTPVVGEDWYEFDLSDGQHASIVVEALSGTDVGLELYDSSGNLLQTGVVGDNVSKQISSFVDGTTNGSDDSYYARITGVNSRYSFVVTRDAYFESEANDNIGDAQSINDVEGVFGYVSVQSPAFAEPDSFGDGTILDNAFSGVTLLNGATGGSVYAATAGFGAPTGTNVFALAPGAPQGWGSGDEFRANFDSLQQEVSLDIGSDDASDIGYLRAFDSSGNLLVELVSGSVSAGNRETLTISRPSADIAYVTASGVGGDITPLDNLQFSNIGSDDFYSFDATAGEAINLFAAIPGTGPFWFDNGLDNGTTSDLQLELIDPSGTVVASGSEALNHVAGETGTYVVQVTSLGGGGEYYLGRDPGVTPIQGIDFGPDGAAVWTDYAGVEDQAYDSGTGYGWISTDGISSFEGQRGSDLTRDKIFIRNGEFAVDLPNGMYEVDVFLGAVGRSDRMAITVEGSTDLFTPRVGPNVTKSYIANVTDGQLTMEFDGGGGLDNRIRVAGFTWSAIGGRQLPTGGDDGGSKMDNFWVDGRKKDSNGKQSDSVVKRADQVSVNPRRIALSGNAALNSTFDVHEIEFDFEDVITEDVQAFLETSLAGKKEGFAVRV